MTEVQTRPTLDAEAPAPVVVPSQQQPSDWAARGPANPQPRPDEDALVEQAKGVLILRYGVGPHESLAAMLRWGRDADVPLLDIARVLVKGVCQGQVRPHDRGLVRWLEARLREDIQEPEVRPRPASQVSGTIEAVPASRRADVPDAETRKQWRYTSAVQAARKLNAI